MDGLPEILVAVIPIYLLMVVGGILRRAEVLGSEMDSGLTKLVIHVLYPALILDKVLRAELLRDPGVVFSAIGVGFVIIMLGLGTALLVGRVIGLRKGTGWRSFTLTAGIQNYGYVAIPLLIVFFPKDETTVLGLLFTHSLGVELGIWTLGMYILRGRPVRSLREFLTGPIVAVLVGLILVFARFDLLVERSSSVAFVFDMVLNLLHWLGVCAFPVGLLLIGTAISDLLGEGALLRPGGHWQPDRAHGRHADRDSFPREVSPAGHRVQTGPPDPGRDAECGDPDRARPTLWSESRRCSASGLDHLSGGDCDHSDHHFLWAGVARIVE